MRKAGPSPPPGMVEGSSPTRVLFAAPFAPRLDAHHGGSRAIAHLLSALVGRLEVGLLYLRGPDEPELDPALASRCARSEAVPRGAPEGRPFARIGRRARLLRGLLNGRPSGAPRGTASDHAQREASAGSSSGSSAPRKYSRPTSIRPPSADRSWAIARLPP